MKKYTILYTLLPCYSWDDMDDNGMSRYMENNDESSVKFTTLARSTLWLIAEL